MLWLYIDVRVVLILSATKTFLSAKWANNRDLNIDQNDCHKHFSQAIVETKY